MASSVRQIKFVDTASGSTSATTIAGTFDSAVLSGSTLVVVSVCNRALASTTSLSDSVNGSWSAFIDTLDDSNAASQTRMSLFVFQNTASGTPTVTATFDLSTQFRALILIEVDGVLSSSLDKHVAQIQAAPGTGTDAVTTGNTATLTQADNLVIAVSMNTSGTQGPPTQGTGYTSQGVDWAWDLGFNTIRAESKNVSATTAVAGTFTVASGGGSERYSTFVVVLKDAAAATTGTGAAALSPLAASGSGAAGAAGTGSAAVSPLAASGSGTETISGTGAAALSPLAASGSGAAGADGTGTAALSPLAMSGASSQGNDGTGSAALSPLAASGSGTETMSGTGTGALSPLAASGSGAAGAAGTGSAALSPLAASGSGTETISGTGSAALSPLAASGSSVALRQPPLLEYQIREASGGQGPSALLDTGSGTALDLTLTYSGSTPSFTSDANGRGLDFPTGGIDSTGARSGGSGGSTGLSSGSKVFDGVNGATQATLEVKCTVPTQTASDGIAMIFGVSQEDGEGDTFMMWVWGSQGVMVFDFSSSAGYDVGWYRRDLLLSDVTAGVHIFHMVVDTSQAVDADRLKVYMDGTLMTLQTPAQGHFSIPQNTQIAVAAPGAGIDSPSGSAHHNEVLIGGWFPYFAGDGGFKGKIYYAALHTLALNTTEISNAADRMIDFMDGSGSMALSSLAASGSGAAGAAGTGSAALSPLAASGSGTEGTTATGSLALSQLAASGAGGETMAGTGSVALSPLAASGSGAEDVPGTGSVALSPLAASGSGSEAVTGTGSTSLRPLAMLGTDGGGQTQDPNIRPIVGRRSYKHARGN